MLVEDLIRKRVGGNSILRVDERGYDDLNLKSTVRIASLPNITESTSMKFRFIVEAFREGIISTFPDCLSI